MRIPLKLLPWSALLVMMLGVTASAQEFRATVTGRVADPAGLAMPGGRHATNTQTNEVATAVTSSEGVYSLPFLRPGMYTVTAELEGFRKLRSEQVQLEVGQIADGQHRAADRAASPRS